MGREWENCYRSHGLIADLLISSDAVRARLTAEAVAEAADYAGEILLDPRLYSPAPPRSSRSCKQYVRTSRRS